MAVLQFDIDRQRVADFPRSSSTPDGSPVWKWRQLLVAALSDTLTNGGTFIVVATEERVTAIQHARAVKIEDEP